MGQPQRFKYKLDQWEGLNTYSSTTDLRPGEATTLSELEIRRGKMVLGESLSKPGNAGSTTAVVDSGNECNRMWVYADNQDTFYILSASVSGTDSVLRYSASSDWAGDTWTQLSGTLFAADTPSPASFQIGGDLRIGGSLTNSHKIVRYWPQTDRLGDGSPTTGEETRRDAGLYMDDGLILAPNEDGSSLFTPSISTGAATTTFVSGDSVVYGFTYTYDNNQESLMLAANETDSVDEDNRAEININIDATNGSVFPWRVTHINVYRQLNGGDFYLLTRIHMNDGELNSSQDWSWNSPGAGLGEITVYDTGDDLVESYTSRTGYYDFLQASEGKTNYENTFEVYWGAGCVCQGRAVIGNVKRIVGETGTPNTTFNDRLYFSPPGKFDSFYKDDWVDLETGDGDAIVHLEPFGSQVLVFKSNNLYVWDMGSRDELNWRLVKKYRGMGITSFRHVVDSPYGVIFWTNRGLYLYDGTSPKELARDTIRGDIRDIDDSDGSAPVAIGFDIKNNSIILGDVGDQKNLYRIDLDDGWASTRVVVGSTVTTINFDNYINGDFFAAYESGSTNTNIINLNNATTKSLTPSYYSGDLNLGTDTYKRVTRIRVRYKSAGDVCSFSINTDGGSYTDIGNLAASANYTTKEFYPNLYGRTFAVNIVADGALSSLEIDSLEFDGKIYDK